MSAHRSDDTGFVPTMGAFHEGHISLMRAARREHRNVCVSLFVNPLQFGRNEDLSRYPRNEQRDFEMADEAGVDVMFVPTADEMYPQTPTTIHVHDLSERWEGESRPGHFDGVATVVAKLFNIVAPRTAYFGWKDLQQCLVIRRMVSDLNMRLDLEFLDTVREHDGLAMSSRNTYLSAEERSVAPMLHRTLTQVIERISTNLESVERSIDDGRNTLQSAGFNVEYLDLVSMSDMRQFRTEADAALIVAARLGTTRLIDNLRLFAPWQTPIS
jgi:pantoate--beta-alanine ligase